MYVIGLIKPLLHETRSWLDGLTQKLYNEYAPTRSQADTSANPPNNEDELQIWLVTAMKHPTTGLIVSLRRKILAETQVDFESLFMTGMVEVLLCNGDQNLCLDWNIHIDLCSNCKLNIGGELKYIPRPWSTKFDKLGNPPAKYALSAIPWLTREHRAEFLPANNEAINDRKWTMAEPKLQTEGDYSPNMCKNGRVRPQMFAGALSKSFIFTSGRTFRTHSLRFASSGSHAIPKNVRRPNIRTGTTRTSTSQRCSDSGKVRCRNTEMLSLGACSQCRSALTGAFETHGTECSNTPTTARFITSRICLCFLVVGRSSFGSTAMRFTILVRS